MSEGGSPAPTIERDGMVRRRADRGGDTGKHRQHGPMDMAGCHQPHARMAMHDAGERVGVAQVLHIHVRNAGDKRRMVQEQQRRPRCRRGERHVEPSQRCGIERAMSSCPGRWNRSAERRAGRPRRARLSAPSPAHSVCAAMPRARARGRRDCRGRRRSGISSGASSDLRCAYSSASAYRRDRRRSPPARAAA